MGSVHAVSGQTGQMEYQSKWDKSYVRATETSNVAGKMRQMLCQSKLDKCSGRANKTSALSGWLIGQGLCQG